jgi:hypothetical protein
MINTAKDCFKKKYCKRFLKITSRERGRKEKEINIK